MRFLRYWTVLTGHSLWRIPTEALRDARLDDAALAGSIERVHTIVATDGIEFDHQGHLWLGGLEGPGNDFFKQLE